MLALLMLSATALVFTVDATCLDGTNELRTLAKSVEDACGSGVDCLDVDACETTIANIGASAFDDIADDLATCTTDDEKNMYQGVMLDVVISAYKCGAQSKLEHVTNSSVATDAVLGATYFAGLLIADCPADCIPADDDRRRRQTLVNTNNNNGYDDDDGEIGPSASDSGSDSGSSGSSGSEDDDTDSDGCEFPFTECSLPACSPDENEFGVLCSANDRCVGTIGALLNNDAQLAAIAEFIAALDDDNDSSRARRAGHLAEVKSELEKIQSACTPTVEDTTEGPTGGPTPTGAEMISSFTFLVASSVIVAFL